MKILLLITLLTLAANLCAQDNYSIQINSDSTEWGNSTFETNTGKYITLGSVSDKNLTQRKSNGLLIEFDDQSNTLVKIFSKQDTSFQFFKGFQKTNGNFFVYGMLSDTIFENVRYNFLYLCEIDPEFELIWEKTYPIPDGYVLRLGNFVIDNSGNIVIFSSLRVVPYSVEHLFLNKFDMDGNLIATNFSLDYIASILNDFILKPDGTGYYVIGGLSINGIVKNTFEIDSELNIVNSGGTLGGENDLGYPCSATWLPTGDLFIVNEESQETPGAYLDLQVRLTDSDFNTINDTVIIDPDFVYTPVYKGVDYVYDDLIWTCTFHHFPPSWPGTEIFKVYLFDSDMKMKGMKVFGGDSRWWFYDLLATTDGGCIITGVVREKEGSNIEDTDLYILKVMPEDIITNTKEIYSNPEKNVLIFPNPFSDVLFVKTSLDELSLSLFTSDGKEVLTKNISSTEKILLNTSVIPTGVYYYKIINDKKVIQSGKLIKH